MEPQAAHFTCEGLIHGRDLTAEPSLIQPIGRRPELMQKIIKPKRNKSSCTDQGRGVQSSLGPRARMPNMFLVHMREQMKFGQALPEASQQPGR